MYIVPTSCRAEHTQNIHPVEQNVDSTYILSCRTCIVPTSCCSIHTLNTHPVVWNIHNTNILLCRTYIVPTPVVQYINSTYFLSLRTPIAHTSCRARGDLWKTKNVTMIMEESSDFKEFKIA